jgi:hypothetical protein
MPIATLETAPASPVRLLVLVAVAVGVVAGAFACAGGLTSGAAHAHGPVEIVAPDHVALTGHGSHDGIGTTDRAPAEPDTDPTGHPGMSCVVDLDLRVAGGHATTICDRVATAPAVALEQRTDGPEPPVPRAS